MPDQPLVPFKFDDEQIGAGETSPKTADRPGAADTPSFGSTLGREAADSAVAGRAPFPGAGAGPIGGAAGHTDAVVSEPAAAIRFPMQRSPSRPQPDDQARQKESEIPKGDAQLHTGIIGGSGSGKTYLFQSLVHRLETPGNYGVLTRFLKRDGVSLYLASQPGNMGVFQQLRHFNETYKSWERLQATNVDRIYYYYLLLACRSGWLGRRESTMKLSFLDCSGELFQELNPDPHSLSRQAWKTFDAARVMVFCLPLWAVFPSRLMKPNDWRERGAHLKKFLTVIGNYKQIRKERRYEGARLPPCRFVIALTQADDQRCALETLAQRWIHAYVDNHKQHLNRLSQMAGPTKYLAGARAVSDYVRKEFADIKDPTAESILPELEIDGNKPWLIPVTAIDGKVLDRAAGVPPPAAWPTPAHVELLLLLGLCEAQNALM